MKVVGYLRVSTDKQENLNQRSKLDNYSNLMGFTDITYIEAIISSRANLEDRRISELLNLPKETLVICTSLDRLGRSVRELSWIIGELRDKGINLYILDKNLSIKADKTDIASTILITILSLTAEIERDLISVRTKTALARIREHKKLGRPQKSKLDNRRGEIDIDKESLNLSQMAKKYNCSRNCLRNFLIKKN